MNEKKSAVKKLKEKIYSREEKNLPKFQRRKLSEKEYELKRDFSNQDYLKKVKSSEKIDTEKDFFKLEKKKKMTLFTKIFIFSIIFFIFSLLVSVTIFFLNTSNSSFEKITMSILGPTTVNSGEEFKYTFSVLNENSVNLEGVDLVIDYPKGAVSSLDGESLGKEIISLGEIKSGALVERDLSLTLFGALGEKKDIRINLTYSAEGYSSFFSREKIYSLGINSSPVSVLVRANDFVTAGEEEKISFLLSSNSNTDLKNLLIKASYPTGFSPTSFSQNPVFSNNIFRIFNLKPGETKEIEIYGNFKGSEGAEKYFNFEVGEAREGSSDIEVVYGKTEDMVKIQKPLIDISITMADNEENFFVIRPGERNSFKILLENNSLGKISDLEAGLFFEGDIFEKRSIIPKTGFYSSLENKINWDSQVLGENFEIDSKKSLSLDFNFSLKNTDDVIALSEEELKSKLIFNISGRSFNDSGVRTRDNFSIEKEIFPETNLSISERIVKSVGPFKNDTNFNPKANEKNSYTVYWSVSNTILDLQNVEVSATLPPNVSYNKNISNPNANFRYEENERKIIWNIGQLQKRTGYSTAPLEIIFGLDIIPSENQIGKTAELLSEKKINGYSSKIEATVYNTASSGNTILSTDPAFNLDQGVVVP